MMMTADQAKTLTTLLASLRSDWDPAGIYSALAKARTMGSAAELALASIKAAATDTNRTPAVIAMQGPHWTNPMSTSTPGPGKAPRCTVYGHDSYPARTCPGCRTEHLTTGTWPTGTRHQEAGHTPTEPDAKTRAAGGHHD